MAKRFRHVGAIEAGAANTSYTDSTGAYMDYDGATYAQFGAKAAASGSLGVKLRTMLAGVVKDAVTIAASGLTITLLAGSTLAAQTVTAASLATSGIEQGVSVTNTTDTGIVVTRTGVADTTRECYLAFFANDADGSSRKVMSISSKWGSTNGTNGYSVARFNSDQIVAGVTTDDIQIRLFGGHGMSVFGPDDSTFPGDKAIGVYGTVRTLSAIATPSAFATTQGSYFASTVSGAVLMGYGTTGDVTLKNRAGTDVLVVGPNTTAIAMAGTLGAVGTITTDAYLVTGGTAGTGNGNPIKFGIINVVSPTAPNRTLTINSNGTVFYIPAKTTND